MIEIKENVDLTKYNTYRFKSVARYLAEVVSESDLREVHLFSLKNENLPIIAIGAGSNIVLDGVGYEALFVVNRIKILQKKGTTVNVGAGNSIKEMTDFLAENGLSGAENLAGIPGTVGGAVFGNAGAFGFQIGDIIESINFFDKNGRNISMKREQLDFGYRTSDFKKQKLEGVIVSCTLKLSKDKPENIKKKMESVLLARQGKHPAGASCGSFFRNIEVTELTPEQIDKVGEWSSHGKIAAGKLIDEAGCKGMRVGGVYVSDQHANFLMNDGTGNAGEVKEVADQIKQKVFDRFDIELEEEARYL